MTTHAPPVPYWTDFRGPRRDGDYRERPILTNWPAEGFRPVWKQPVGGGHASFVVAGGRAFTIEQRGNDEVAAAYDVATGRELWTSTWPATFSEAYGGDGPRATPVWRDATLFVLGAAGELRALDAASGQLRWRTNILEDASASNIEYGVAASPLVVGETVVVLPGGSRGRSVVAYRRDSGKQVWSALDDDAAYSSPMLVTLGGARACARTRWPHVESSGDGGWISAHQKRERDGGVRICGSNSSPHTGLIAHASPPASRSRTRSHSGHTGWFDSIAPASSSENHCRSLNFISCHSFCSFETRIR